MHARVGVILLVSFSLCGCRTGERKKPVVACAGLLDAMGAVYAVSGASPGRWIELAGRDYWPSPKLIPFMVEGAALDVADCRNGKFVSSGRDESGYVFRVTVAVEGDVAALLFRVDVEVPEGELFSPRFCLQAPIRAGVVSGSYRWGCGRFPFPRD